VAGRDLVSRCGGCGLASGIRSFDVTEIEIRRWTYERICFPPHGEWEWQRLR
jgi:hypothetical protein